MVFGCYCDVRNVRDSDVVDDVQVAGLITDFLQYKESNCENGVIEIIEYLCTSWNPIGVFLAIITKLVNEEIYNNIC